MVEIEGNQVKEIDFYKPVEENVMYGNQERVNYLFDNLALVNVCDDDREDMEFDGLEAMVIDNLNYNDVPDGVLTTQ